MIEVTRIKEMITKEKLSLSATLTYFEIMMMMMMMMMMIRIETVWRASTDLDRFLCLLVLQQTQESIQIWSREAAQLFPFKHYAYNIRKNSQKFENVC